MKNNIKAVFIIAACALSGCDMGKPQTAVSDSGATKYTVKVPLDAQGRTIEQRLVGEKILRDNRPGAFKYVYIINAMTGKVMDQSVAVGKVVSSGKRLSPSSVGSVVQRNGNAVGEFGNTVVIGSKEFQTSEVLGDDGTYGSSSPYLYWITPQNSFQQCYIEGAVVRISDVPLVIREAVLTMEIDHGVAAEVNKNIAPEIEAMRRDFKAN